MLVGGFLELIVALAGIGTAVTLYPVVKRQNEGLALGFVTARLLEGAMIFTGVVSLLSLVTLRQALGGAAGADSAVLAATAASHVAVYNWTFLLSQSLMPGINAVLLGTLLYRSRLVPRVLPVLALIGGPLLIVAVFATLLGGVSPSAWPWFPCSRWPYGSSRWASGWSSRASGLPRSQRPWPLTAGRPPARTSPARRPWGGSTDHDRRTLRCSWPVPRASGRGTGYPASGAVPASGRRDPADRRSWGAGRRGRDRCVAARRAPAGCGRGRRGQAATPGPGGY